MTDKERILLTIIRRLYFQYGNKISQESNPDGVYFANWKASFLNDGTKLKSGMLVVCMTGINMHDWMVSILVNPIYNGWKVREIGSDRTCNITNESFVPIEGMFIADLLEGDDYKFYEKVVKAFIRGNEYKYRFGGIEIIEKKRWKIFIREVFGGINLCKDKEKSVPFSCIIDWDKKTSIKYILLKMREAGYGTKEFERINIEAE